MQKWFIQAAGLGVILSLSATAAHAQVSFRYNPYAPPMTAPDFNAVPGYSAVPPATVNPPTPIVQPPYTHFSPTVPFGGGYWGPGGNAGAPGSPYYYSAGGVYGGLNGGGLPGDPYSYHFGPGYYRSGDAGHYRFPWYSYRRPWYFPGHVNYNRDTNLPW